MTGEAANEAFLKNSGRADRIKQMMDRKFAMAIEAHDCDRITFESLQSIRFTWDATRSAIKDREADLLR